MNDDELCEAFERQLNWAMKVAVLLAMDTNESRDPAPLASGIVTEVVRYLVHRQKTRPFDVGEDPSEKQAFRPHHLLEYLLSKDIRGQRLVKAVDVNNLARSVDDLMVLYGAELDRRKRVMKLAPKFDKLSEVHEYCRNRAALQADDPDYVLCMMERLSPEDPTKVLVSLRVKIEGDQQVLNCEVAKDEPVQPVRPVFSMTDEESHAQRNFAVAFSELVVDEMLLDMRHVKERHRCKCFVAASVILEKNVGFLKSEFAGASQQERTQFVGYVSLLVMKLCQAFVRGPEAIKEWLGFCEVLHQTAKGLPLTFQTALRIRTHLMDYQNCVDMMALRSESPEREAELHLADLSKAALKTLLMTNGLTIVGLVKPFFPHWVEEFPDYPREDVEPFVRAINAVPLPSGESSGGVLPGATDVDRDFQQQQYLRDQLRACMDLFTFKQRKKPLPAETVQERHPWYKETVKRQKQYSRAPGDAEHERIVIT